LHGTDVGLTAAIKLSRASILLRRTRLAHLTGEAAATSGTAAPAAGA
jgi:hypothetical protein